MPRLERGIQYAAAYPLNSDASGILDRPVKPGDDTVFGEKQFPHFAFRKSPTSSSTNSSSSALFGSRLEENGRLLSLPTMMWVSSTRSTFSMVKNGKV